MSATIEQNQSGRAAQPELRVDRADSDAGRNKSGAAPRSAMRKRLLVGAVAAPTGALLIAAIAMVAGDMGKPEQPLIYYTVTRGELAITVTERGNLESQDNVKVLCEIDDIQGDNINGTPIMWIIPNGSSVKKGDLLVEFDVSNHQERLDQQILNTDQALAEKIKAKAKYENQKTQNATTEANADLELELAKLELEMFKDPEKGTHELEKEEIKRLIEDINNEILAAQANLELKKNDKLGIEALYKLGYAGKSEVDRSRLEYLQAESAYAAKMNKLKTQLATLDKKEDYEKRMQLLKLQGAVDTADRNLKQVREDNRSLLEQAEAALKAAEDAYEKEEELLQRYREQVDKAKIEAPQDGMVAYAVQRDRYHAEIGLGAPVRPKQHIISLPNLEVLVDKDRPAGKLFRTHILSLTTRPVQLSPVCFHSDLSVSRRTSGIRW